MPRTATGHDPTASSVVQRGRTRRNVTQACFNCRQRKKKCDGVRPTCATCVSYNDQCVWTVEDDWRKPLSRDEANALRARVDELEKMVERFRRHLESPQLGSPQLDGQDRSTNPSPLTSDIAPRRDSLPNIGQPSSTRVEDRRPAAEGSAPRGDGAVRSIVPYHDLDDVEGMMVQDDRGYLRVHGPTSAFHYQPTPSRSGPNAALRRTDNTRRFARYLPKVYLPKEQHDLAIDRFFRYFSACGQRATPHLFYRDMEIALDIIDEADLPFMAPNYSPGLHNVIVSLGLAYAEEEYFRAIPTRSVFNEEASQRLELEVAAPCLATVQALALRTSCSSTVGDYSVGWVKNGLATRLCYAIGLHVDTSPLVAHGKLTHEAYTQRNVTFWSTFCQEEMWAIYIGRSPLMGYYSTPLPVVDDDTDQVQWTWPPGPMASAPPQPSFLSLTFVHTTKLMLIATDITNTVYTGQFHKSTLIQNGAVQRFNESLDAWFADIPEVLQFDVDANPPVLPHVLLLPLCGYWIVILLFQPFAHVSASVPGPDDEHFATYAMTRCHQAALKIDTLAAMFNAQHGLRFTTPTHAQIVYTAGTTFLLAAAQAAQPAQTAALLDKVRSALAMLREIGLTWNAATQKAAILDGLLEAYTEAAGERQASPVQSPEQRWNADSVADMGTNTGLFPESTLDMGASDQEPFSVSADRPNDMEMAWAGTTELDEFIQSLFSQSTLPFGGDADLMALLQDPQSSML